MRVDLSLDGTTDTNVFRSIHEWSESVGDPKRADRAALDRVAVSALAHDEVVSAVAHDEAVSAVTHDAIEFYEMLITEVAEWVRRSLPNCDPENHDPKFVSYRSYR